MGMESNPLEPTKNAEPQPSRLLLNMQDVAERLQLNIQAVRRLCANGDLPATKFGTEWRVSAHTLELWTQRLPVGHISTRHKPSRRRAR